MSDANLIETRSFHSKRIYEIDLLTDGRLISVSGDRCVALSRSSSQTTCIYYHSNIINNVKVINSQYVATGDLDGNICIRNLATNTALRWLKHGNSINDIEAMLDGRIITASKHRYIRIYNIFTGYFISIDSGRFIFHLKMIRSDLFVAAHSDRSIRLYYVNGLTTSFINSRIGHTNKISGLDFIPSLNYLLSIDENQNAFIWNMNPITITSFIHQIPLGEIPFSIKYLIEESNFKFNPFNLVKIFDSSVTDHDQIESIFIEDMIGLFFEIYST
jgi:WD40 repeat protein